MKERPLKKGFTLIELLAVIVVLAIIALIATPIVMNLIKNATKGAAERSADNYLSAVETMIATERLDGTPVEDGTYTISGTKLKKDDKEYTVELNGNTPTSGSVVISNGQVVDSGTKVVVGDYKVKYNSEGKLVASINTICELVNGDAYEIGSKYICDPGDGERTFYVLENLEGSQNISLIMDRNIDEETVPWCDQNGDNPTSNLCDADGAKSALASKTSKWKNDKIVSVTLPTAQQIATAGGDTEWNQSLTGNTLSDWLYFNLDNDTSTPQVLRYWTSTAFSTSTWNAWLVTYEGMLNTSRNVNSTGWGAIRPVITISKSNL